MSTAGAVGAGFGVFAREREGEVAAFDGEEKGRGEKLTMHLTDAIQLKATYVASVMFGTLNFVHQLRMTQKYRNNLALIQKIIPSLSRYFLVQQKNPA